MRLPEAWGWGLLGLAALAAAVVGESAGEMLPLALLGALLFPGLLLVGATRASGGLPGRAGLAVPGALLLGVLGLAAGRGPEPWGAWVSLLTWAPGVLAALALGLWADPRQGARSALGVLAAAAALSAYGVFQRGWGLAEMERAVLAQPLLAGAEAAGSGLARAAVFARLAAREPMGSFAISNTLAALLVLALPLLLGLARDRFREGRRPACGILLLAAGTSGTVLAWTGSKGAWLALGAAAAAGTFLRLGRSGRIAVVLLAVALLALASTRHSLRASLEFRAGYARAAGRMLLERPWGGAGLGGFEAGYNRTRDPGCRDVRRVHCDPLQLWTEAGIWAPAALLWLAGLCWNAGRAPVRESAPSPPGWLLPGALAGAVLALAPWTLPLQAFASGEAGRWALSAVLAAAVLLVARAADGGWGPSGRRGALGAVLAFGIHALGDFPLQVPGSALPAWVLLGALAAQSPPGGGKPGRALAAGAVLAALAGMGTVILVSGPATGREGIAEASSQRLAAARDPLPEEARTVLDEAAGAFPERFRTRLLSAEAARRAGDREGAAEAYARASALRPGDVQAAWALAWMALERGDREGALAASARALRGFPAAPRNHLNAARLLEAAGRADAAARARREALRLDGVTAEEGQRLTPAERDEARRP